MSKSNSTMKILVLAISIAAIISLMGCPGVNDTTSFTKTKTEKLVVFAASSLTESFTRLADKFEKQQDGNIKVILNFAGSQALRASVEAGAKADIFAGADVKNMDALKKSGFVTQYKVFVKNRLALVVYTGSKYRVEKLTDLGAPGMKLAVADKSVPVGGYWAESLDNAEESGAITSEEREAINANISTKELNVKDVLSKVLLGEADAGVVYGTDVAGVDRNIIREINIPCISMFTASYPAAVLKVSENKESANQFYSYLFTRSAKDIFEEFGFLTEVGNR